MSGAFIGSMHRCNRPEARQADVGLVWACHCGRRWAVAESLYYRLRVTEPPVKDNWPFESRRAFTRRLAEWQARTDELSPVDWYEIKEGAYIDER